MAWVSSYPAGFPFALRYSQFVDGIYPPHLNCNGVNENFSRKEHRRRFQSCTWDRYFSISTITPNGIPNILATSGREKRYIRLTLIDGMDSFLAQFSIVLRLTPRI